MRRATGPVHLLLCIADHYEPQIGGVSAAHARARVERWVRDFPRQFGAFRDSDGRPPRHTFFYPIETYDPEHLDALAALCRAGFGEVEIHLHHDNDTAEHLRNTLLTAKQILAERHGLLARDRTTGELAYGFIHGNWALDNAAARRPMVRGQQRAGRAPGDRLLRRLHLPLGSQPDADPQDQQHLLRER